MSEILLCGYYGFGNAGDEAILEIIAGSISLMPEKHDIKVLTADIGYTSLRNGLKGVSRMKPAAAAAVIGCDTVIFGGGSLFQDATSFMSILYYACICMLARLFGKKYVLAFQGLGPINRKASRTILKSVLRRASYVSLRDRTSYEYAKKLFDRDYFYTADPAFLLADKKGTDRDIKKAGKKIVFILKDTSDGKMIKILADTANMLKDRIDADIYHISLYQDQDEKAVRLFSSMTGSAGIRYDSTSELIDTFRSMDLSVSARYHGLVFSACAGTPCIPVSYDPKVTSLYKELEIKGYDISDDICPEDISDLAVCYLDKGKTGYDISKKLEIIRARAQAGMSELTKDLEHIVKEARQ
jgi:polysaccharide pyruvyl transferase CsaB